MIEFIPQRKLNKLKFCITAIFFVLKHSTWIIENPNWVVLIVLVIATLILFAKSVISAIVSKIKFL